MTSFYIIEVSFSTLYPFWITIKFVYVTVSRALYALRTGSLKNSEWIKLGVYEYVYEKSLIKYMKTTKITEEMKYQSIDSTFVEDINGSEYASYNGIYKRKKGEASKGIKITSIVSTTGIPISVTINNGHNYDSPLLSDAINNCSVDCNTQKYKNHNRFKQYF